MPIALTFFNPKDGASWPVRVCGAVLPSWSGRSVTPAVLSPTSSDPVIMSMANPGVLRPMTCASCSVAVMLPLAGSSCPVMRPSLMPPTSMPSILRALSVNSMTRCWAACFSASSVDGDCVLRIALEDLCCVDGEAELAALGKLRDRRHRWARRNELLGQRLVVEVTIRVGQDANVRQLRIGMDAGHRDASALDVPGDGSDGERSDLGADTYRRAELLVEGQKLLAIFFAQRTGVPAVLRLQLGEALLVVVVLLGDGELLLLLLRQLTGVILALRA